MSLREEVVGRIGQQPDKQNLVTDMKDHAQEMGVTFVVGPERNTGLWATVFRVAFVSGGEVVVYRVRRIVYGNKQHENGQLVM